MVIKQISNSSRYSKQKSERVNPALGENNEALEQLVQPSNQQNYQTIVDNSKGGSAAALGN